MTLSRRKLLSSSVAAAVSTFFGGRVFADVESVQKAIAEYTGGSDSPYDNLIEFKLPEIAENGHSVPVSVSVKSAMTTEDYVDSVMIFSGGNPNPEVATFFFSPLSGEARVSTRMRLGRTQNVSVIAKLSDGTFHRTNRFVAVTVGGCGV